METRPANFLPIDDDTVMRLRDIALRVWQNIGPDFVQGHQECGLEPENEAAVECCFDADRPLLCQNRPADAVFDQAFCKDAYEKYGFSNVVWHVAQKLTLV